MKPKILFLEDSDDLGTVVMQLLQINGFEVQRAARADEAYELLVKLHACFDLLIIDVGLPGRDGFEFTEQIRQLDTDIPFLFLTARAEKDDRIRGLKYGASDYITKPFDIEELLLRIRNIVRRPRFRPDSPEETKPSHIVIGDLTYFQDELAVSINGKGKEMLTRREAQVLEYLIRFANRLVKKDDLLQELWGGVDYFKGRSLDTYIGRLKKILQASEQDMDRKPLRGGLGLQ
ncbi:MAG: response regulator transcription factor [Leadbetterella sp.]|nr:response regulator transcription factor [Leadbetterella sp.]